ncbi:hypothetical protein H257_08311 [Aphanomyces astaci]|uniref:Uncharacterized protein n=1 Tax=Aphanomyces astaci TaxID=112090 RepID=W4GFT3_APHAT|nr:hypothetical protein H257_08311 [Aphanomyces astaci]ETV78106.1 hypothetical protein H257_08311 [Aphanomyces astaci]RHY90305.1 hypothetical protein DYB35_008267 [Aphanomyces astaci]RHZ26371.1 hypothetical protein DYB37_003551 [Aphanomyces astaci]RQM26294.1 hypothetical protein B5M09_003460 [Aphanomyces astaci]|eukprot:XP_009832443.1 hypothetical protein H257_08311 [Aphanomyces astaci]
MATLPPGDVVSSALVRAALARKMKLQFANLLYGKNYLVDRKAFMAHLSQESLTLTLLRAGVVAVANPYAIPDSVSTVLSAWSLSFWRAISYTTVTRVLEEISVQCFTPRIAGALMKDVAKSSLRKYARYQCNRTIVASLIFHTAFRSAILPNAAVLIVESGLDMCRRPVRAWPACLRRSLHRFFTVLAYTSLGAALATLIEPGAVTRAGAIVGEACAYGSLGIHTVMFQDIAPVAGFFWHIANTKTLYLE